MGHEFIKPLCTTLGDGWSGCWKIGKKKIWLCYNLEKKIELPGYTPCRKFMVHIKSFKNSHLTHICIVMKVGHLSKSVSTAISSSEAIYWKKEKKLTTVVAIPQQKKENLHLCDVSCDLLVGLLATWCQNVNSQNVLFFLWEGELFQYSVAEPEHFSGGFLCLRFLS